MKAVVVTTHKLVFSPLTEQLIENLRGLPGVGPKTAQRMAFNLLSDAGRQQGLALSAALQQAITNVGACECCRIYTENKRCGICQNPKRNRSLLCVVETAADVMAIEQTNIFQGLYFVLQGHLSPLDGIGPADIGIPTLFERLNDESITELIIATNPTMEGKATAHYIANHAETLNIKCSRIAHGVPVGGELEYLDGGTLALAFQLRNPFTQKQPS